MSWQDIAERAARPRRAEILARFEQAITEHAPAARVARNADELHVTGRGLKARWISEAGLRFARRIGR